MLCRLGFLLLAGSAATIPEVNQACAAEFYTMRGAWLPDGEFLPFYWDLRLTSYLTPLAPSNGSVPVAVLPVYSREPICLTRDSRIFVSTGLLLSLEREEVLAELLAAQMAQLTSRRPRRPSAPSPCAFLIPEVPSGFASIRADFTRRVAQYEEWTRPRLRIRSARPTPPAGAGDSSRR